ncbi:MAG TPA: Na+/H+ antiporter NhaA [Mycobacteriales bacterium]|jgi:NhaA family Na+:H+ antiporter|nr:Na+/H+ antiporter NhaA [Mycobacteriales bacterium]
MSDHPTRERPAPERPARRMAVADYLRVESVGGAVLLLAAALALLCANTPLRGAYHALTHARVPLLRLDVAGFAAEGLLSVFFFVAGLEVKRELVTGELRHLRNAALPVVAAAAGMVAPALVFLLVAWGAPGAGRGWTVPVATDIAFALGVLAFAGTRYPASLRVLLLSLAVVDDLGAIALIALLFAHGVRPLALLGCLAVLALYAAAQRRGWTAPYAVLPLALLAWLLAHAGGVHATVAAVGLALLTPVERGERLERLLQPWSAGVVVPVFAFTAAGLPLDAAGLRAALTDRIAVAVFAGLVLGKLAGIAGGTALATRLRVAARPAGVTAYDTVCLGALGGVGFTVSLLLADLAFTGSRAEHAKTGVLAASVTAGLLAALLLRVRRHEPR